MVEERAVACVLLLTPGDSNGKARAVSKEEGNAIFMGKGSGGSISISMSSEVDTQSKGDAK